jgi:cellulose synthase/poly-beta-1,6-N-acetylglucosamine synthase-like glycosyltransferase
MENAVDSKPIGRVLVGELLVGKGLITEQQLKDALALQAKWGSRVGDILLAKGWIKAFDFYKALSEHFQRPFVNLMSEPPDAELMRPQDLGVFTTHLFLPWKKENGRVTIATANPSDEGMAAARMCFGNDVDYVITSKFDILWQLQNKKDYHFSERAVNHLVHKNFEHSAAQVFTTRQLVFISLIAAFVMVCLTAWPLNTLIALNTGIAVFLMINFGMRAYLAWVGSDRHIDVKVTDHQVKMLSDRELPIYTVLVPMYKEAKVLPKLAHAIRKLDYPMSKLDVKLILEEDDEETIAAAKAQGLESVFEIIRVPHSLPKTKPKACNYALNFARGEFVTIYDAEDLPEPDQLKKAVAAFSQVSENTVCIQARLNYFNSNENWLTRVFTLEYSLWFDFYLPALEVLGIPIPLGGTSNHFRMEVLRKVGAWDPFNVTEDADLGVRFTQLGLHVGVVNSTTFEEANNHFGNWIRQRSRWLKGYMQTYLVHMRRPVRLYRTLGTTGFWGFQFFIGGTILSVLVAPLLFGMFFLWLLLDSSILEPYFPPLVLYISLFNFLIGNGYLIYLSMVGAFKRNYFTLIPYALTVPAYWFMMSIAAYKGLWQLVHNPFYWEKTEHGISSHVDDHHHNTDQHQPTPAVAR